MTPDHDLIVIGEGIAGLTCAEEAARLGLKVATFEAEFRGGLVINVNELERFDAADGLSGMDHATILAHANAKAGVVSTAAAVTALRAIDGGFAVESAAGVRSARAVVLASGARLKPLGIPGEEEFAGRGVSHCADCDAPMFAGAEVVVAGDGDWAVKDALVLVGEGVAVVHLVHEGDSLSAGADYRARLEEAGTAIQDVPRTRVEAVLGGAQGMTGVRLRDADGGERELACAGLFAMIGLEANSAVAPAEVRRDDAGFVVTGDDLQTDLPGLFAIGQVRAGFGGWLADAAAEARRVAQAVKTSLG